MPPEVTVAVVGSLNLDLVARVRYLPRPGETVTDAELSKVPGGKGANQAVAAARLGANVRFVGAIGEDDFGTLALEGLREAAVDLSRAQVVRAPTGNALILGDAEGENEIVVVPGANHLLDPKRIEVGRQTLSSASSRSRTRPSRRPRPKPTPSSASTPRRRARSRKRSSSEPI